MVSMSECGAVNPSSRWARDPSATSTAGSPLTPTDDATGHVEARYPFNRVQDFPHREAPPGTEIDRDAVAAAEQVPHGGHVRIREIGDVDIVANGGTVRGRVVAAEDGDFVEMAQGGKDCPRDEVRLGFVALADLAVGVAATGVEVP